MQQHRARQGYLPRWQGRDLPRSLLTADRSVRVVRQLLHGTKPLHARGEGPPGAHVVKNRALSGRHRQAHRVRSTNATGHPAPVRHNGGRGDRVWVQQPARSVPSNEHGRTAAGSQQTLRHHPARMGLCRLGRGPTSNPRCVVSRLPSPAPSA